MGRIVNISGTEIKDHGIQVLADYINKNLSDDFTLILGCKPYTSDVDGVLIGKGSIFAIEVKDWKGNIRARSYGLWEKDRKPIENPLSQTRNNAVALAKWLRSKIGEDRLLETLGSPRKLWVTSLLVFTNPKCSIDGSTLDGTSNTGVNIISLNRVKDFVMQQEGDEQIGQMVQNAFSSLGADVRSLIKRGNRRIGIGFLVFASIGIFIFGAYAIWSNDPAKTIFFFPVGFFAIIGIAAIIVIVNPADTADSRRTAYYKRRRYCSSSSNEFDPSNYGQADAVLTNYIMDGH